MGTLAGQESSGGPESISSLVDQASGVIYNALAKSTFESYTRTWAAFLEFLDCKGLDVSVKKLNASHVMIYLMSLVNKGLASSTIISRMSALNFVFKLLKLPEPSMDFWIKEFLIGLKKMNPQADTRIAITLQVLEQMIKSLDNLDLSSYDKKMFKAMFTLMFHGFLRPGEVTGKINNLMFQHCDLHKKLLFLTFFKFKHHKGPPYSIKVERTKTVDCPVRAMHEYLAVRGSKKGPLFCFKKRKIVSYSRLSNLLKKCVSILNIKGKCTPHCFRIGAATWAASQGASDQEIKRIGRWSNDSFLKYVRIPILALKLKLKK